MDFEENAKVVVNLVVGLLKEAWTQGEANGLAAAMADEQAGQTKLRAEYLRGVADGRSHKKVAGSAPVLRHYNFSDEEVVEMITKWQHGKHHSVIAQEHNIVNATSVGSCCVRWAEKILGRKNPNPPKARNSNLPFVSEAKDEWLRRQEAAVNPAGPFPGKVVK